MYGLCMSGGLDTMTASHSEKRSAFGAAASGSRRDEPWVDAECRTALAHRAAADRRGRPRPTASPGRGGRRGRGDERGWRGVRTRRGRRAARRAVPSGTVGSATAASAGTRLRVIERLVDVRPAWAVERNQLCVGLTSEPSAAIASAKRFIKTNDSSPAIVIVGMLGTPDISTSKPCSRPIRLRPPQSRSPTDQMCANAIARAQQAQVRDRSRHRRRGVPERPRCEDRLGRLTMCLDPERHGDRVRIPERLRQADDRRDGSRSTRAIRAGRAGSPRARHRPRAVPPPSGTAARLPPSSRGPEGSTGRESDGETG